MRYAAFLFALFTIGVGLLGLVSPDSLTVIRRVYSATAGGIYWAASIRFAMGLVLILSATVSRAPRVLRVLGALVCMQGISAAFLGPDRARAVLEFEAAQGVLLRIGAAIALATGGFVAFALTGRQPKTGEAANLYN